MSITAGRFGTVGSTKHLEKESFESTKKSNTKVVMEVNDDVVKNRCRIFLESSGIVGRLFCLKPNSDWAIKMVIDFLLRKWWSYSKDVLQKYHDFSFGEPGLQKLDWFFYGRRVVILCKNGTLQMWWSKGFFRFGFNAWKLQFIFALFGWSLLLEEFWNIFGPEL